MPRNTAEVFAGWLLWQSDDVISILIIIVIFHGGRRPQVDAWNAWNADYALVNDDYDDVFVQIKYMLHDHHVYVSRLVSSFDADARAS